MLQDILDRIRGEWRDASNGVDINNESLVVVLDDGFAEVSTLSALTSPLLIVYAPQMLKWTTSEELVYGGGSMSIALLPLTLPPEAQSLLAVVFVFLAPVYSQSIY